MYTIEVSYRTGSSFHSEDVLEDIGLIWQNKELAVKALQSLKEHYTLYLECEDHFNSTKNLLKRLKSYSWFNHAQGLSYWTCFCMVEMDDGQFRNLPSMYIGYFESLHYAELKCTDHKVVF